MNSKIKQVTVNSVIEVDSQKRKYIVAFLSRTFLCYFSKMVRHFSREDFFNNNFVNICALCLFRMPNF